MSPIPTARTLCDSRELVSKPTSESIEYITEIQRKIIIGIVGTEGSMGTVGTVGTGGTVSTEGIALSRSIITASES